MPNNYSALVAAWNATGLPAGVTGTALTSEMTPQQKLAAIQGWVVAGPTQDVTPGQVTMYLASQMKLTSLRNYSQTASPIAGANAAGVNAALDLFEMLTVPAIKMSDPTIAAGVEMLLAAMVADTANSGITATDQANLLALGAGPSIPWWQSIGLASPITPMDLTAAAITTPSEFPGA
jgi:hypothetical protein